MRHLLFVGSVLAAIAPAAAQRATIDASAPAAMYRVLVAMHDGASETRAEAMLDSVLDTRAYTIMFHHYNRVWRPHHLPRAVFRDMILSLAFPARYSAGTNERADQMLPIWRTYYGDLAVYEKNLRQLDRTNLQAMVHEAVGVAQSWLPPGWNIPDFEVVILPSGGSKAFSIDTAQGYDFLQLPRDSARNIQWDDLRSTIAHESHHTGQHAMTPSAMTTADSVAYRFLTLFTAEGTATKFVNDFPGGCVPRIDPDRRDPAFSPEVESWWARYTPQERDLMDRFVATFERARPGTVTSDSLTAEMGAFWLNGYVSPVYFIGGELYGAVYVGFGKPGLFTVMRDARELLPMYNEAVRKNPRLLGSCVLVPDSTVRHAQALGRER